MVDISKINKEIAIFIVFLILIIIAGLFIKMTVDMKPSVNTSFPVPGSQVGGLYIQFKDEISESEVKTILQNPNMTMNYSMKYDTNSTDEKYYIMVDKDKITDIRDEFGEENNWTKSVPAIKKENYYIITVSEQATHDKNFLAVLDKYNLQLKRFVWCEIRFYKGSKKWWIPEEDAIRIKNELEQNESIFTVQLSYLYP